MRRSTVPGMSAAAAMVLTCGAAVSASTTPDLNVRGETIEFTGTFKDRLVPDLMGSIFRFTLYGADGGDAIAGGNGQCFNGGGRGATVIIDVPVGSSEFTTFAPGGTVRAIVGGAGENGEALSATGGDAGGGGGGTGLLYSTPTAGVLEVVAVAGGGGGAYSGVFAGICVAADQDGRDAETGTCGSSGNGAGGAGGCEGIAGISVDNGTGTTIGAGGGAQFGALPSGGGAGLTVGGAGGTNGDVLSASAASGGFGYGGGGAAALSVLTAGAGGGGGYSGGGAGAVGFAGGGGGSFADAAYHFGPGEPTKRKDSPGVRDGQITYEIVGQVHNTGANAIALSRSQTRLTGSTIGATSDGSNVWCFGPGVQPLPNVWYKYTNTSNDVETMQFSNGIGADRISILRVFTCLGSGSNAASATLQPGDAVNVIIESNADTFSLDLVIAPIDSDGDGVPDSIDVCPGVDDTTLTVEQLQADTDNDGIIDLCDQACPEDLVPDGVFTSGDIEIFILFIVFGGDPSAFDFTGDGVFDFFDWAELGDGCE